MVCYRHLAEMAERASLLNLEIAEILNFRQMNVAAFFVQNPLLSRSLCLKPLEYQ